MADTKARKDIELLKYKRDTLFQKIDFLYNLSQTLTVDASVNDLSEFKVRCERLPAHYEGFDRYQGDLVKCYLQLKEPDEIKNLQSKNQEVDHRYFHILSAKEKLLRPVKTESNDTPHTSLNAKLPKINLPTFDGTLKNWPHFRDLYTALVHSSSALTPIEKFHFLLTSTKDEPNALVKSLPMCSNNYDLVWKQLNDRYDNKRLLASQYVEEILNLQSVNYESPKLLRNMLDLLNENTMALKSMNIPEDLGNFIILHVSLKKVDKHTRQIFERKFSEKEYPTLEDFLDFLKDHCKSLDAAHNFSVSQPNPKLHDSRSNTNKLQALGKPGKFESRPTTNTSKTFLANTENQSCLFCAKGHTIYSCPAYLKLTPNARRDFIKSKESCFNCLSPSHMRNKCNSTNLCRKCHKPHHTTLHEDNPQFSTSSTPPSQHVANNQDNKNVSATPATIVSCSHLSRSQQSHSTTLLGTALIQVKNSAEEFQTCRALLDPGSQSSFITDSCVKKLCLPRSRCDKRILGLSQTTVSPAKGSVTCTIKPINSSEPQIQATAIILNKITSMLPSCQLSSDIVDFFKPWSLADPEYHRPAEIDFLIGADLFPDVFIGSNGGRHECPPGFPSAFHTIFGVILLGHAKLQNAPTLHDTLTTNLAITDTALEHSIKRFWEIEEPPLNKQVSLSPEDSRCEEVFVETHSRDVTGRYMVKLPFRENVPQLGNSYELAEKSLLALERRFSKNEKFKAVYSDFMLEYENLGHMSCLNAPNSSLPTPLFFIPHHGVFKNSDTEPKLRVVFNASARSSSGHSLNDTLLIGEKLQNDVCEILSRFRLHEFVLTADICKMYRQILVAPEHRPYQAILWRSNPQAPINTFYLNTVTYGVNSSPFLAIRTLKQLVQDEGSSYPLASSAVLDDMFVDDCLTGADSLSDAMELKNQLIDLLQLGCFQLGKWASNSTILLQDVKIQQQDILFDPEKDVKSSVKVLGLKWNPATDSFSYDVPPREVSPTKRGILSHISRIFDPLGLITPVVFWAKCMMQKIWILGLEWDQALPPDLLSQCNAFFEELPTLSQLLITRHVLPCDYSEVELHGFADASELGYGCAVYLRVVNKNGSVHSSLLMAKSKVAPLKRSTIPKLELCGALLLSKTIVFCQKVLSSKVENIPIYAWTDSTVTLHWIYSPPHLLKTFVGNRVSQIQTLVDPVRWHHTPTASNAADPASRGLRPHQILDCNLWWFGPDWLKDPSANWPPQKLKFCTEELTAAVAQERRLLPDLQEAPAHITSSLLEKFSTFTRLQNCIGWICRFKNNCKAGKEKITSSFLTVVERASVLITLAKIVQLQHFNDLIISLSSGKNCPKHLLKLDPFLDGKGVVRVGGRLRNSSLCFDQRHPILLPKRSHLTTLLINHYHVKYLHVGPRTLQSLISRQFWIISARSAIRHHISKCIICVKFRAKNPQPFMGNLPAERIKQNRAFLKVGVDMGGPYTTKSDKLRKPQLLKSYICLFVCLSTKAVHLEMVSSLSCEAFLAALNRFVSRRGLCTDIFSDQGTNFVCADKELTELHNLISQPKHSDKIMSDLSNKGINWHFNPPAAPNFGGLWEAGIKSTKHHIRRVLGTQTLTFEEFSTLLAQIEAILNSRPLSSLSPDVNEFNTLTPGHFLIGEPLVALPQHDLSPIATNRLSRWQLVQQAAQHFWKRWSLEYLHEIQQRQKWFKSPPNLKIGDLVAIKDDNLPVQHWRLGRVLQVHPGEDNIIRVVTLRTLQGQLKRPVSKLCLLPVEE